jgi:hypothetical protein
MLVACLVNKIPPHPRHFLDVWQTKGFKPCVFGSVARKGVTGAFFGCVANTEVSKKGLSIAAKERNGMERWVYALTGNNKAGGAIAGAIAQSGGRPNHNEK